MCCKDSIGVVPTRTVSGSLFSGTRNEDKIELGPPTSRHAKAAAMSDETTFTSLLEDDVELEYRRKIETKLREKFPEQIRKWDSDWQENETQLNHGIGPPPFSVLCPF